MTRAVPDDSRIRVPRAAWLPSLALVIHVCEELPTFPAWATLRFGTTTPLWFVLSHIPILATAFWISRRASHEPTNRVALWWLLALQVALVANGVFHVVASIGFREYSPGLVSSVLIYTPMSIWLVPPLVRLLGVSAGRRAALMGCLLAVIATGTLFLDVTAGWGS